MGFNSVFKGLSKVFFFSKGQVKEQLQQLVFRHMAFYVSKKTFKIKSFLLVVSYIHINDINYFFLSVLENCDDC